MLTGTAGDDTFIGIDDGAATSTSTLGDTIDGGAGSDTVRIITNQTTTEVPTLTNVETLQIVSSVAHESRDVSSISGLTTFELENGTTIAAGELLITVAGTQTVVLDSLRDGDATTDDDDEGEVNLGAAATVTTLNLILDDVGASGLGDIDIETDAATALKTLNITSQGKANFISLADAGTNFTTLNVTGDQKLTITALPNSVTTVNLSGATGGSDVTVGNGAVTFTGGAGADRVVFAATEFTSADKLDGGAGSDILAIADTDVSAGTAALITALKATTGFGTLELTTTTAESVLDANDVDVFSTFVVSGAITDSAGKVGDDGAAAATAKAGKVGKAADNQAFSFNGIETGDTIEFDTSITGGVGGAGGVGNAPTAAALGGAGGKGGAGSIGLVLAPELDTGLNAATIILDSATIAGGAGGAGGKGGKGDTNDGGTGGAGGAGAVGVSATAFETLTIDSVGISANSIAGGAGGALGAGGAGDTGKDAGANGTKGADGASVAVNTNGLINVTGTQDLNLGTISGTNATVNASTFTGKLTVTGEAGNNTIIGGSGNDTIDGGAGQDVLTGGAGDDTFVFSASSVATPSDTVFDIITDFNNGKDKIDFGATALTVNTAVAGAVAGTASINSEGFASFDAADNTLAKKLVAVEVALRGDGAAGEFAIFVHDSDSYVFISDNVNGVGGADVLIQLQGVTGLSDTTLTAGDLFIA